MLPFVLLPQVPFLLWVSLAGLVYLAWLEVHREALSVQWKLWWCLLVVLLNVPGYVALRVALPLQRRNGGTVA